jgi:hypothetical protein
MKIQQPIPHWNNFTVAELKEVLEHCQALERLGIAQDEDMMSSVERDIALREKQQHMPRYVPFESEPKDKEQQSQGYVLA